MRTDANVDAGRSIPIAAAVGIAQLRNTRVRDRFDPNTHRVEVLDTSQCGNVYGAKQTTQKQRQKCGQDAAVE